MLVARRAACRSRIQLQRQLVRKKVDQHMKDDRREAVRAYKARATTRGIFALRCAPAGKVWVGSTPNLATITGELFSLRQGSHRNAALQAAWNEHGEQAFETEILEEIDQDIPPSLLADVLKRRLQHWTEQLGVPALYPRAG
jgi:hypothetical protein